MFANIVLVTLLLSSILEATSSMVIKHTYYGNVHYIETGLKNYAFVGIGAPQDNFKGIAVNDDQLEVERDGCDKKIESCVGCWVGYLSTMVPSYANIPLSFTTRDASGTFHSLGSVGGLSGLNTFSHKKHFVSSQSGSLEISSVDMPMNLVQLMFINDMVVFIYLDGRIETSAISCITDEQREYLEQLQMSMEKFGIVFNSAGSLTYDRSQDKYYQEKNALMEEKNAKMSEALAEQYSKSSEIEAKYQTQIQQLESERPTDWIHTWRDLQYAMRDEKYRIRNEFYEKRDQISEEFNKKIQDLESQMSS